MSLLRSLSLALLPAFFTVACLSTPAAAPPSAPAASAAPPPLAPDQKVTISFTNYNLAAVGPGKEATELLLREFQQKFPNITVEPRPVPALELTAKVQAEVVAGNGPDLVQMIFGDLDFAAHSLRAKPLDQLVPPAEFNAYVGGEHPLLKNGLRLTEIDGKAYGVPYVFSTQTLFYNADMFRQAGLDPDQPPKTWAEIKQYGQQIKVRTGLFGFHMGIERFALHQDWMLQSLVMSNGGYVLSPDRTKFGIAQTEAVETLTMWQDLVKSGVQPATALGASDGFQAGKVAMELTSSASQAGYLAASKGKWELRAAAMPSFGTKPTRPTNSGSALIVVSDSPVKQRAAWELMRFLTSERAYTVIQSQIGYLPLRPTIVNDPRYLKDWLAVNPLARPNLEQLDRLEAWLPYPGPNYVTMRDVIIKAAESVVFNGDDPHNTMRVALERVTPQLPKS